MSRPRQAVRLTSVTPVVVFDFRLVGRGVPGTAAIACFRLFLKRPFRRPAGSTFKSMDEQNPAIDDALRAALLLRYEFPEHDVKVREIQSDECAESMH